jgi:hypothetical protein
MNKIILLLSLILLTTSKPHLPDHRYTRIDSQWKDYKISGDQTIGFRPDTIDDASSAVGSTLTLQSTEFLYYGIKCEDKDCTPVTLYELIQKYINTDPDQIGKILKLKEVIDYDLPEGSQWRDINKYMNTYPSSVSFITKPVKNNIIGNIYELDLTNKTFKYYDDLGQLGEGKFDDVYYLTVTIYALPVQVEGLKWLS